MEQWQHQDFHYSSCKFLFFVHFFDHSFVRSEKNSFACVGMRTQRTTVGKGAQLTYPNRPST
jgi:hypothetical protein